MDKVDELVWNIKEVYKWTIVYPKQAKMSEKQIMDNRERGIKLLKKWCADLLEIEE